MNAILVKLAGYFAAGGLAAAIDVGVFAVLLQSGLATLPAAVTSFCLAAVCNFQLSSRYVFRRQPTGRAFAMFFFAALIGLAVNAGTTMAAAALLEVHPVLAKVIGIGCAFGINFLLNLRVVFKGS